MIWEMKVAPLVIMTPRLRLRQFRREDAEPFSAMNADPTGASLGQNQRLQRGLRAVASPDGPSSSHG
jgi:hypothetical protein